MCHGTDVSTEQIRTIHTHETVGTITVPALTLAIVNTTDDV